MQSRPDPTANHATDGELGGGAPAEDSAYLAAYARHVSEADRLFASLVQQHGAMVHQTCLRIVGDAAAAEDAAQATFLVLAKRAGQVRGSVGAFLHGVAVNIARRLLDGERLRKLREREAWEHRDGLRAAGSTAGDERMAGEPERVWAELEPYLDEAIERLPTRQRQALVMHYLEGRKQEDVAVRMGLSRGTVAKHVQLGLANLRQRMARRQGLLAPVGLVVGRLEQFAVDTGCPEVLVQKSAVLSAAGTAKGAVGLSPQVVQLGQGAIHMMVWAKVKAVAIAAAACALLSVGVAVAFEQIPDADQPAPPVVAPGEKPAEKPAPALTAAQIVEGLKFEPFLEKRLWLVEPTGAPLLVHPTFKLTNVSDHDITINRLWFKFDLIDPAGQVIEPRLDRTALLLIDRLPETGDMMVLKPNETRLLDWETDTPKGQIEFGPVAVEWSGPVTGHAIAEQDRFKARYYPVRQVGAHQIRMQYQLPEARATAVDPATGKQVPVVSLWNGPRVVATMPVDIQMGVESVHPLADNRAEVSTRFGTQGCILIRSAERRQRITDELKQLKLETGIQSLGDIDFSRQMLACVFSTKKAGDTFHLTSAAGDATRRSLRYRFVYSIANRKNWELHCIWILLPKSVQLDVGQDGAGPQQMGVIDAAFGDIVDGLQGRLVLNEKTGKDKIIPVGGDIQLHFELRVGDPNLQQSIWVWDNKYSEGYRNDAYLVTKPDGSSVLLRRVEQAGWDKNIPSAIEIKPKAPWTLGGIANDPIEKSLHALGLDTSVPGEYTIVGLYMQKGGDGSTRTVVGAANKDEVPMWAGTIATSPITVTVTKP